MAGKAHAADEGEICCCMHRCLYCNRLPLSAEPPWRLRPAFSRAAPAALPSHLFRLHPLAAPAPRPLTCSACTLPSHLLRLHPALSPAAPAPCPPALVAACTHPLPPCACTWPSTSLRLRPALALLRFLRATCLHPGLATFLEGHCPARASEDKP